jgi:hypothetical protein
MRLHELHRIAMVKSMAGASHPAELIARACSHPRDLQPGPKRIVATHDISHVMSISGPGIKSSHQSHQTVRATVEAT